jgi:hypothetical protein
MRKNLRQTNHFYALESSMTKKSCHSLSLRKMFRMDKRNWMNKQIDSNKIMACRVFPFASLWFLLCPLICFPREDSTYFWGLDLFLTSYLYIGDFCKSPLSRNRHAAVVFFYHGKLFCYILCSGLDKKSRDVFRLIHHPRKRNCLHVFVRRPKKRKQKLTIVHLLL